VNCVAHLWSCDWVRSLWAWVLFGLVVMGGLARLKEAN
jgi:hypothetical protein